MIHLNSLASVMENFILAQLQVKLNAGVKCQEQGLETSVYIAQDPPRISGNNLEFESPYGIHTGATKATVNPGSDLLLPLAWWHLLLGQTHQSNANPKTVIPALMVPSCPHQPLQTPNHHIPSVETPYPSSEVKTPASYKGSQRATVTITGFLPGRPWKWGKR